MRTITIKGQFNHIHVRDEVNGAYHRFVIGPTDTTSDPELQALKAIHHTQEVIDAYIAATATP